MSNGYKVTQELYLDWLSFSYKYDNLSDYNRRNSTNYSQFDYLFNVAFPELKKVHYIAEGKFRSIYEKCMRMSYDILVYYDSEDFQNKGCYVTVPSHSIEYFCTIFGCTNIYNLFRIIIERGGSFSRLDICYDDYSKRFSPRDFRNWFESGNFRTRLRRFSYICSGGSDTGTFYLGHRAGLRMLRIYDKLYESSKAFKQGKTDEIIDSVRYEFEMHSYAAQEFAKFLIENSSITFSWLVAQFFDIIDRDDCNITRCSLLKEWETWLSELEFCELLVDFSVRKRPASYFSSRQWFTTFCMNTAARIFHKEGEKFLQEIRDRVSAESLKDDSDFKIYEEVLCNA